VAHRRLHSKAHASQLVLSFLAVAVIGASVGLLLLPPEQKKLSDFINVMSICASIIILVLGNLEYSKNYQVLADRMQKGAQALSPLHDELEFHIKTESLDAELLKGVIDSYNGIINEFEVQHEDIDYVYFQSMHATRFSLTGWQGRLKRWDYRIRYFLYIWGIYILCIGLPFLVGSFFFLEFKMPAALK
jgi:hypothetical protein